MDVKGATLLFGKVFFVPCDHQLQRAYSSQVKQLINIRKGRWQSCQGVIMRLRKKCFPNVFWWQIHVSTYLIFQNRKNGCSFRMRINSAHWISPPEQTAIEIVFVVDKVKSQEWSRKHGKINKEIYRGRSSKSCPLVYSLLEMFLFFFCVWLVDLTQCPFIYHQRKEPGGT